MKFKTYTQISQHLVDAVILHIGDRQDISVKPGYSNVSCSSYINVDFFAADEDGDYFDIIGGCKVRFSDHRDNYGSDKSIRFDDLVTECDHEYEIADEELTSMVSEAVEFILSSLKAC